MENFKPNLYPIEQVKLEAILKLGDSYGSDGIVATDNPKLVCYDKKPVNCKICTETPCPFNGKQIKKS